VSRYPFAGVPDVLNWLSTIEGVALNTAGLYFLAKKTVEHWRRRPRHHHVRVFDTLTSVGQGAFSVGEEVPRAAFRHPVRLFTATASQPI